MKINKIYSSENLFVPVGFSLHNLQIIKEAPAKPRRWIHDVNKGGHFLNLNKSSVSYSMR